MNIFVSFLCASSINLSLISKMCKLLLRVGVVKVCLVEVLQHVKRIRRKRRDERHLCQQALNEAQKGQRGLVKDR